MLRWFRKIGLADKNKSLLSGLGESRYSLVGSLTYTLVIRIVFLSFIVIALIIGLFTILCNYVKG
jgi:hypothetical protein